MTYRFRTQVQLKEGNYTPCEVAHIKYTLTNDNNRDTVLCLIVRKQVPAGQTAADARTLAEGEGCAVEDLLRELAEDFGWLE